MKLFTRVVSALVSILLLSGTAQAQIPTFPDPAELSSQWGIPGVAPQRPQQAIPAVPQQRTYDPLLQGRIEARIADVLARYGGNAAISIDDGMHTYFAGNVTGGPAMSTIKVPIAIAAERNGTANPVDVADALIWSSNEATDRLYAGLGEDADAKIQNVIAEVSPAPTINAGDWWPANQWAVTGQAQFARKVECLDPDRSVIINMSNVVDEQRYGLGRLHGAMFKGGWSPMDDGQFYARQFGNFRTAQGSVGVAIAAQASNGSYATAQAMLNELADEIAGNIVMGLGSPLSC